MISSTSQLTSLPTPGNIGSQLTNNTMNTASLENQRSLLEQLNNPAHDVQGEDQSELKKQFNKFVGGTFFRQMLTELQKSAGKPAYFHGGQAEEMFRSELNSTIADQMAEATGDQFSGSMFELFNLQRTN